MPLLQRKTFISHAGLPLNFKIECDDLTDEDIATLAEIIGTAFVFASVYGVPRGGTRLAAALEGFRQSHGPTLIVDDVLTTGTSMEDARLKFPGEVIGVVIFARGRCPEWVKPVFQIAEWADRK